SARPNRRARSDLGAATTCPVQFMISAVSKPPGVPSDKKSRTDLPTAMSHLLSRKRLHAGVLIDGGQGGESVLRCSFGNRVQKQPNRGHVFGHSTHDDRLYSPL